MYASQSEFRSERTREMFAYKKCMVREQHGPVSHGSWRFGLRELVLYQAWLYQGTHGAEHPYSTVCLKAFGRNSDAFSKGPDSETQVTGIKRRRCCLSP